MDHLIGKGIDGVMQYLYSRRMGKWGADLAPYLLKAHLRRFGILATMAAGRELSAICVKGDTPPRPYLKTLEKMAHPALLNEHGFGWCDGETLFLPLSMAEMPDIRLQESLTRVLVFFLATQASRGTLKHALLNRALLENDRLASDLYWIIENTRLTRLIREAFPGVFRDWPEIVSHLISRRPDAGYLNKAEQKVEEFLKSALTATSTDIVELSGPEESLKLAIAMKERWQSEGIRVKSYRAIVPFTPWGKLITERIKKDAAVFDEADISAVDERAQDDSSGSKDSKSDPESGRYAITKVVIDEEKNERGLALNIYDKLMSWAEFVNVTRPFDDDPDDDASDKADSMEELTTAEVKKKTGSFFNADIEKTDNYTDAVASRDYDTKRSFLYPEWDYQRKAYRPDASRVGEHVAAGENADFVTRTLGEKKDAIREVVRKFETLTPAAKLSTRQVEGEFIDLNAVVEAFSDFEADKTPSDRLYATYTRNERDISALFLVDLSMSTDAWVDSKRIIDHEKEALIILCEAMTRLRDRYAIYGFSGKTRKDCRYYHIKGFDEPYGDRVKERVSSLIPYHYTRMGPAIRHATSILKKEPSRARLLFLISDGKPNDVDVYEGRYGLEDTRMAIKEAEREGIIPFCLTVDTNAREYLPRLFGKGNYAVVSGAARLAKSLPELYARIIHQL